MKSSAKTLSACDYNNLLSWNEGVFSRWALPNWISWEIVCSTDQMHKHTALVSLEICWTQHVPVLEIRYTRLARARWHQFSVYTSEALGSGGEDDCPTDLSWQIQPPKNRETRCKVLKWIKTDFILNAQNVYGAQTAHWAPPSPRASKYPHTSVQVDKNERLISNHFWHSN